MSVFLFFIPEPDADVGFRDFCCFGIVVVFVVMALLLGVFM